MLTQEMLYMDFHSPQSLKAYYKVIIVHYVVWWRKLP